MTEERYHPKVSSDEARESVYEKVLGKHRKGKTLYYHDEPLNAGTHIENFRTEIEVKSKSWFFLIDDEPNANWSHPCRYVLIDVDNGDITIYNKDSPPTNLHKLKEDPR